MHHLKALGRSSGFHPEIVSRVAQGVAGLQVEAALVLLHDNPKEAARVLQEAFSFVEDQKAVLQQSIADLADDFQRNCVKRLRIGSPEGIEGPRLSPADSSQVGQGNDFHASVPSAVSILVQDASPPICWDVWLFSVRARLNLPEHTQVGLCTIAKELMRALRFGCGLDVAAAGLKLLLQRSLVTVWSGNFLDDVKDIVVTCAELYGQLSADAILHATKWLLEAEEILCIKVFILAQEGSSFASKALGPASGTADQSLLQNNHNLPERLALQILAEDIVQTSVTQKKKELHSLLHSYGALQFEQGNFKRSRGLFIAALHYAPASQYGSSARMVAASSKWLGSFDDALAYIDLAEQHDPGVTPDGPKEEFWCMIGVGASLAQLGV
ncbi:hypothetical protein CEUSTIGMA_g4956.t1 [Chlamydomonas eustigma]|uniref:Uncharacterized protein n=1 Tax=Chlamydomonas eustigma TaxID=1157962 RepID=A0A250X3N3_9CHLO|nr:hypothetical protein CEUSTIGMA_g4956.t1 [Chlamydomonas eustigma]|eukprot:GAX77512.1 hypothetical protein CEUSTIGMA_g4956.t1 [Chlamydomonas eustigma]